MFRQLAKTVSRMFTPPTTKRPRRAKFVKNGAPEIGYWTYQRPGQTMAQQQRAARKPSNVKRHKKAVRRAS